MVVCPVDLRVEVFELGVSQNYPISSKVAYKEAFSNFLIPSWDHQVKEMGDFSCFILSAINVLQGGRFFHFLGAQSELCYHILVDEVFGCSTVD